MHPCFGSRSLVLRVRLFGTTSSLRTHGYDCMRLRCREREIDNQRSIEREREREMRVDILI